MNVSRLVVIAVTVQVTSVGTAVAQDAATDKLFSSNASHATASVKAPKA